MSKKYLMLDLNDSRISNLADVLGNKTSKKIVDYLAENNASEAEIARDLKMPANTVNYNVKKLLKAGLIEKSKEFFWSVKGKKVPKYKVANKKIVISPKSSTNVLSILGAFVGVGLASIFVKSFTGSTNLTKSQDNALILERTEEAAVSASSGSVGIEPGFVDVAPQVINNVQMPEVWIWFLLGGALALIIFMILNWRKL